MKHSREMLFAGSGGAGDQYGRVASRDLGHHSAQMLDGVTVPQQFARRTGQFQPPQCQSGIARPSSFFCSLRRALFTVNPPFLY
jgi:hypothetical protein